MGASSWTPRSASVIRFRVSARSDGFPLVEAIFESQVADSRGWSQLSQANLREKLKGTFDGEEDVLEPFGIQVSLSQQGATQQFAKHPPRLRLWTKSRGEMFQFDAAMCAYNIMGSYTKFEDYTARLRELVGTYFQEARPSAIEWTGQRYINRVELPASGVNPADVFAIYPQLPTAAKHRPFGMQVVVDDFDDGDVVVGLNFQGIQNEKALYFLDLYVRSKKPIAANAEAVVAWHVKAHEPVRRAFSMALTQKAFSQFRGQP